MIHAAAATGTLTGLTVAGVQLAGLVVVPSLLQQAGMPFAGAYTAYVLAAVLSTFLLGMQRLPLLSVTPTAIAGWLVYVRGISAGLSWQQLLGVSAAVSLLLVVLSLLWQRKGPAVVLPPPVEWGLSGGCGLLLVVLGLTQGRLLVAAPWAGSPTPMMLGDMQDPMAYLSLCGIVVTLALLFLRVSRELSLFLGMMVTAAVALAEGFWALPAAPCMLPEGLDVTALQLTLLPARDGDAVRMLGTGLALGLALLCLNEGVLAAAGCRRRSEVSAGLGIVSAVGSFVGSLPVALSPLSILAGQQKDSGTRRPALTAAVLLLAALFFEPVLAALADFPAPAVPVLVVGGLLMLEHTVRTAAASLSDRAGYLAGMLTVFLIPLAGDFVVGLGAGCLAWSGSHILAGRGSVLTWPVRGLSIFFLVYFILLTW